MTTASKVPAIETRIEQSNRAYEEAIRRGDAAAVVSNYTETARILPPNSPVITGKPGIQAYWQQVIDMGIEEINLETMDIEILGDTAWEMGQAVMKADHQIVDRVKYIIIWKEEDGHWRKHRGTWNSNRPA